MKPPPKLGAPPTVGAVGVSGDPHRADSDLQQRSTDAGNEASAHHADGAHPLGATVSSPVRLGAILEVMRAALASTERLDPADQDRVYSAVLAHVRARRPGSVGCLGQLPPPSEVIRDPRGLR